MLTGELSVPETANLLSKLLETGILWLMCKKKKKGEEEGRSFEINAIIKRSKHTILI